MKQITKQERRQILSDRWWTGLLVLNVVVAVVVIVVLLVSIQPKETQVINHFSAFDLTPGFYRGYWCSLLSYVLLEVAVVIGHALISLKLHYMQRRDLALALLWATLGTSILIYLMARSVISLAAIG